MELADTPLDLCLEFANTLDWHASDQPAETLLTYHDLVRWAQQAGLLRAEEMESLLRIAQERPGDAGQSLKRARSLRETIYRLFEAVAKGEQPSDADLEALNQALAGALKGGHVERRPDGFVWRWGRLDAAPDALLEPLARSAAALLSSELRLRVGQCADDRGCGYLFLDASKNRSRRWCNMDSCGNRAKQRRHYRRNQQPLA